MTTLMYVTSGCVASCTVWCSEISGDVGNGRLGLCCNGRTGQYGARPSSAWCWCILMHDNSKHPNLSAIACLDNLLHICWQWRSSATEHIIGYLWLCISGAFDHHNAQDNILFLVALMLKRSGVATITMMHDTYHMYGECHATSSLQLDNSSWYFQPLQGLTPLHLVTIGADPADIAVSDSKTCKVRIVMIAVFVLPKSSMHVFHTNRNKWVWLQSLHH